MGASDGLTAPILRMLAIQLLGKRSHPTHPTELLLGGHLLTIVLVFLVRGRVARLAVPAAPGGFSSLPSARRPGAIDVVLTGWDGVGTAAWKAEVA